MKVAPYIKLLIKLKAKVSEECIKPIFTYGTETMSLTEKSEPRNSESRNGQRTRRLVE